MCARVCEREREREIGSLANGHESYEKYNNV
jgi:hypothetical protein